MTFMQLREMYKEGQILKADFIERAYENHRILFDYCSLLNESMISEISLTKEGLVATISPFNIKLRCQYGDQRLIPFEIINFGGYEQEETQFVIDILRKIQPKSMLDIGANYGYYSLLIEKIFPRCHVYAFEPIPYSFQALEENLTLNRSTNVSIFNKGLSDKHGTSIFYYYPQGSGNASLSNLSGRTDIETINCELDTVDRFVMEKGIGVDFIKCDVEGAELLVLNGALNTLQKHKPFVFVELLRKWSAKFNYHPNEFIEKMSSLGYICYVLQNGKPAVCSRVTEETKQTNYFFVPSGFQVI